MNNNDLQFLNQLSEGEILALINRCVLSENQEIETAELKEHYVNCVSFYDEFDRRDEKGNQYIYVTTMTHEIDGMSRIGMSYEISDYSMRSLNFVNPHLSKDYSHILKAFMTQKFGKDYIQALYDMKVQEAMQEYQELEQYLSFGRN